MKKKKKKGQMIFRGKARVSRPARPGKSSDPFSFRVGQGFDAHRLETGEGVVLGGVRIACSYRVVAHSDGDVLLHALCDALLGAAGLGDIGHWFPDSDAKLRGADSRGLLREVMRQLRKARWGVVNVDLTLVAQVPRVAPHAGAMRANIAADLGIAPGAVNVKATTTEGLGWVGRKEGIAAQAVALIARK